MFSKPSRIMPPQVGVGGGTPRPMKLSDASVRIAEAIQSELMTTTSEIMLGRICTPMMRTRPEAERAAGLDEVALLQRNGRRTRDAGERRDLGDRDGDDQVLQARAQHRRDHQAEQQRREGQHDVEQAHHDLVEQPADIAGDDADGRADRPSRSGWRRSRRPARCARRRSGARARRGRSCRCRAGIRPRAARAARRCSAPADRAARSAARRSATSTIAASSTSPTQDRRFLAKASQRPPGRGGARVAVRGHHLYFTRGSTRP